MEEKIRINSKLEYKPMSSISFVSKTLKEQNRLLLLSIADKYNLNKEDTEELFNMFWKTNYYCPQIIISKQIGECFYMF